MTTPISESAHVGMTTGIYVPFLEIWRDPLENHGGRILSRGKKHWENACSKAVSVGRSVDLRPLGASALPKKRRGCFSSGSRFSPPTGLFAAKNIVSGVQILFRYVIICWKMSTERNAVLSLLRSKADSRPGVREGSLCPFGAGSPRKTAPPVL